MPSEMKRIIQQNESTRRQNKNIQQSYSSTKMLNYAWLSASGESSQISKIEFIHQWSRLSSWIFLDQNPSTRNGILNLSFHPIRLKRLVQWEQKGTNTRYAMEWYPLDMVLSEHPPWLLGFTILWQLLLWDQFTSVQSAIFLRVSSQPRWPANNLLACTKGFVYSLNAVMKPISNWNRCSLSYFSFPTMMPITSINYKYLA